MIRTLTDLFALVVIACVPGLRAPAPPFRPRDGEPCIEALSVEHASFWRPDSGEILELIYGEGN